MPDFQQQQFESALAEALVNVPGSSVAECYYNLVKVIDLHKAPATPALLKTLQLIASTNGKAIFFMLQAQKENKNEAN